MTETLIMKNILQDLLPSIPLYVIDTQSQNNDRPTTATTAADAANILISDIKAKKYGEQKKFEILFCSNNPYIQRQELATQNAFNDALKKNDMIAQNYAIHINGVGFHSSAPVQVIHSELACLIDEKYKQYYAKDEHLKEKLARLEYQSRNNDIEIPQYDATIVETIGEESLMQHIMSLWGIN